MARTISAIIPTHNRRQYIARAIESILSQADRLLEIIVVDDGSTDGTADLIAAKFQGMVRVIRQENGGVSAARRRGVLEAKGDWIAFLDSDDVWRPGRMAKLAEALDSASSQVGWIFGDTRIIEDDADGEASIFSRYGPHLLMQTTLFTAAIETQYPIQYSLLQSSLIRRSSLVQAGAFQENLRSSEDFLVSFRIAMNEHFVAIPDAVTDLYRTSDLQVSSLDYQASAGPDYYRARALAFDEAAKAKCPGPWALLHEESIRRMCIALGARGVSTRRLALQQFRHHMSPKAAIFLAACLVGPLPIKLWANRRRRRAD